MDFWSADVETGKPVYHNCLKGDAEDIQWMASTSMPAASPLCKSGWPYAFGRRHR